MSQMKFVGRDREARELAELLDRTASGRLSLAFIDGAQGSGRTRVLEQFAAVARRRGATTVPAARWADGDLPAGTGTLVLTGEYPHRIDPRVWPVLDALARTTPVLVVLTRPTGADWPGLDRFTLAGARRIALGPLSPATAVELLAAELGGRPDAELGTLAGVAAGNPGALVDLAAGLREDHLVTVHMGRARLVAVRLPDRMVSRLVDRLEALSGPTRHLLQVASTIGTTFRLRDLARLLRRHAAALLPELDEAIASGLMVGTDEFLRFSHDLVRDLVEASLPRSVAAALRDERAQLRGPRPGNARLGVPRDEPECPVGAGWHLLSEQERVIAVLVGRAMTNQQIATRIDRSPHTVNYHLRQIFRKLGIASRVELASLARTSTTAAS